MKELLRKLFKRRCAFDYILYSAILALGVVLDQLTKWLAATFLEPLHASVPIIEGVLHLTYHENPNAAFGLSFGGPWVFNTFSVIAIIAMLGYLYLGHAENRLYGIAVALMASGGIGNMIDRTVLRYVIDFIDFTLIDFPVFNGADSFVCVGAGLLILALVLDLIAESKKKAEDTGTGGRPTKKEEPDKTDPFAPNTDTPAGKGDTSYEGAKDRADKQCDSPRTEREGR